MILTFHIRYRTVWGENLAVILDQPDKEATFLCQTHDGENWTLSYEVPEKSKLSAIRYKYAVKTPTETRAEWGAHRVAFLPKNAGQVFLNDAWRAEANPENIFFSAAFSDVIFKRNKAKNGEKQEKMPQKTDNLDSNQVVFQLHAAKIPAHLRFCVLGSSDALGNWSKPFFLSDANFPTWQIGVDVADTDVTIEYKYAIWDALENRVVVWETGENRRLFFTFPEKKGSSVIQTDEFFRYPNQDKWRGAGVAIPVFSLRSEQGLGIGEFTDLQFLVDWAVETNLKIVQILPVNDTIATKTWVDSYPYAAISVFALHPLYVNVSAIAPLKNKGLKEKLAVETERLNQLETVDYEAVMTQKFDFFKALYAQEKANFWKDKDVQTFIENNADWLKPYAAFCFLRDQNGTSNFNKWAKHTVFSEKVIAEVCDEKAAHFDDVALYYFVQFHADKQLLAATTYARSKGVILKGDLPIGIYRYSSDAWVAPHLYNMAGQAGAPPDDFAVLGQNWGFPTYNWAVMARDNFAWWRQRMTKLSEYFDALRIDHILGFFRIWEIPTAQVEGTLGLFNPRLPYNKQELYAAGLRGGDLSRFTKPYIRAHHLYPLFGENTEGVKQGFLNETSAGVFELKDFVDNQLKIKVLFEEKYPDQKHIGKALMGLVSEVLLIEEPLSNGQLFNPRITLFRTQSFKELEPQERSIFQNIYNDYFFRRHDEFWRKQAFWKLPALLKATNMLICGEDLGMIPNSVPGVMRDLNIIALEIQRMPKGATDFGEPENYPYMSVCSPSCHDMSTIRGWWEESEAHLRQNFYEKSLHQYGSAPQECSPKIVEDIVNQHFMSPSMWAIFPLQDLVGMDAALRRSDASAEQINVPANPQHYWRFRFHLPIEKLMAEKSLSEKIIQMVKQSAR